MSAELQAGSFGGLRGPDPHDERDWRVGAHAARLGLALARPARSSNRDHGWVPPPFDQQQLGSCVYQTFARAREFLSLKTGHQLQQLSAMFGYYNGRHRFWPEQADEDTGDYLRNGMRILVGRGLCLESEWRYDMARWKQAPPASVYGTAWSYGPRGVGAVAGYRVGNAGELLDVLAAGWPVAFGFPVHINFYAAAQSAEGKVDLPVSFALGYHAVLAVDYESDPSYAGGVAVVALNWWAGTHGGWFTPQALLRFPIAYWTEGLATDQWCIALRSEEAPPVPIG